MARAIAAAISMVAPEFGTADVRERANATIGALRVDARWAANDALQRLVEIPEIESLRHGSARGERIEGLRLRDKVLAGAVISLSTACMMAVALLAC